MVSRLFPSIGKSSNVNVEIRINILNSIGNRRIVNISAKRIARSKIQSESFVRQCHSPASLQYRIFISHSNFIIFIIFQSIMSILGNKNFLPSSRIDTGRTHSIYIILRTALFVKKFRFSPGISSLIGFSKASLIFVILSKL